jgi:hypothetical protein
MIKLIKEAESYGWEVDDWKAQEAYEMFCDAIGKEEANEAIVRCLGDEELAKCLAYLFRMYEFHEWEESQEESEDEEEFDEGCGRKKKKSKKQVKESQASSEAYYDFQEFLGKLEEFIDDNNILFSIKGTKFAGEGADTFEIILSSAYENEEVTTIILEHSNRNDYNAWTATYDFDGDYDDASATYIDDLYDDVTSWIERAAAVAG